MGFIVEGVVQLSNGITVNNPTVSIRGTYQVHKIPPQPMNNGEMSEVKYSITFQYLVYLNQSEPLQVRHECIMVVDIENCVPYAAIYQYLKNKFPGKTFIDV